MTVSGGHGRPAFSPERRLLVVRVQGREQGQQQQQQQPSGGTGGDGRAERAQTHVAGHTAGPQGQSERRRRRHDNGRG